MGFRFIVQKDSLGKYLTLAEDLSGEEGEKYDNVRIPLGENFKFRAHLFINERLALLMINDAVVGLNNKVKSGFEKCYMGEVALSSSDKEATMLIDNLVCERIVSDYESYSVPSVERETQWQELYGSCLHARKSHGSDPFQIQSMRHELE